jgi:hypothetical protein
MNSSFKNKKNNKDKENKDNEFKDTMWFMKQNEELQKEIK